MPAVGKGLFTLCLSLSSRRTLLSVFWRCPHQFDKNCTSVLRHQDWCRSVMKSVMKNKPLAGILLDEAVQCVTLIQLAAIQVQQQTNVQVIYWMIQAIQVAQCCKSCLPFLSLHLSCFASVTLGLSLLSWSFLSACLSLSLSRSLCVSLHCHCNCVCRVC